ncbi:MULTISPECIES: DNA cytosine methyltransferase [Pseudomonas]|jgi:DNA (cytosine-5)-methyltransferase 1|uniref:DNA cytosine methyltransferase n=1 Tax=Pseudomonas TaxID=286 RepID=UPI0009E7FB4B|nr:MULTISPECIES: DNA cytosine methyltransferase [Pseudomonas]MDH1548651.1 DNA cytosine methyltransferase [Pseudomonas juntendi]
MTINVFDFFSGCGGTSCGFRNAGMNVRLGLDIDPDAAKTYRFNFPEAEFIEADIRALTPDVLSKIMLGIEGKVLFSGCAPCQPFSKQNRFQSSDDPRRNLLSEFGRFVEFWLPDYVFVENVPGMQKDCLKSETFVSFTKLLDKLGYSYDAAVVQAASFGVPQTRSRLVLVAAKHETVSIPRATHGAGLAPFSTVRDWIEDLPPLAAGEANQSDPDHCAMNLSEINLQRIAHTLEGGGRENWPEELLLNCHRNYSGHSDVYGRLAWDRPASGLTTKCLSYSNGRFGHPNQMRGLSLREAASLQTFPRSYRFFGSLQSRARQVGNAVPPLMAESISTAFS